MLCFWMNVCLLIKLYIITFEFQNIFAQLTGQKIIFNIKDLKMYSKSWTGSLLKSKVKVPIQGRPWYMSDIVYSITFA
mgnify:CR=1 FL=1